MFRAFAETETGDARRKKIPADIVHLDGKPDPHLLGPRSEWQDDVVISHDFYTLKQKTDKGEERKMFYQTFTPKDPTKIKRVIVIFHGYGDHGGWLLFNVACTHVKLNDAAVIIHDQPGHGRSDGLHVYVPSWHAFVEDSMDFCENVVAPQRDEWGSKLKLFAFGESMGGGVLATYCIKKPNFWSGVILSAPMIAVSDHIKPPWLVTQFLKEVLAPLLPTWPITPTKDVIENCWRDPEMVKVGRQNPLGVPINTLPRLKTASSLAFECPEWLATRFTEFRTPVLIMHGSADSVTEPELSRRLFDKASSTDKTFDLVEGAWHAEMAHGGAKCIDIMQKAFKDLSDWLEERS